MPPGQMMSDAGPVPMQPDPNIPMAPQGFGGMQSMPGLQPMGWGNLGGGAMHPFLMRRLMMMRGRGGPMGMGGMQQPFLGMGGGYGAQMPQQGQNRSGYMWSG
jgi:hypothetical protein